MRFWLRVMNKLKNLGTDDILLALVDSVKGLRQLYLEGGGDVP